MAPANQFLPPSLLRRVETHIRVMSAPEYFTTHKTQNSGTSLNHHHLHHTPHHQQGTAHVSPVPGPSENVLIMYPKRPHHQQQQPGSGDQHQNQNQSVSSVEDSGKRPREFSGFSKIHLSGPSTTDNKVFYDETLKKIIPSALGGQSFTVLFAGAPSSGRSQTMYTIDSRRNGGELTLGMLHYVAQDLLSAGPNVRVFVNAYNVHGSKVHDSRTDKPVVVKNFQSPLGPTPETSSVLLTKPQDANIVPLHKRHDQTNFITFEIYHQHNADIDAGNGTTCTDRRGTFSMITLVDVAPFDDPIPNDVVALRNSISRHSQGSDPNWSNCRLTEFLEYAFCRGRTVIGVGTVVGPPASSFEKTCPVLDFISLMGNLEQVASIAQFQHPKWLPDLPAKIMQLDRQHEERWRRNYERGVFEVYRKMQDALSAKLKEVGRLMESNSEPSERLAQLRRSLREKLEQALAQIQSAAKDEVDKIDRNLKLAAEKKGEFDQEEAELDHATNLLMAKRHDIRMKMEKVEMEQESVNNKNVDVQGSLRHIVREDEAVDAALKAEHSGFIEKKRACVRLQEALKLHWSRQIYQKTLETLDKKKEQLQKEFNEASARAVNQDEHDRRERKLRRETEGISLSQQQPVSRQGSGAPSLKATMSGTRRDRSVDSATSHYSTNNNNNNNIPPNSANSNNQQQNRISRQPSTGSNHNHSTRPPLGHQQTNKSNDTNNNDSPKFTSYQGQSKSQRDQQQGTLVMISSSSSQKQQQAKKSNNSTTTVDDNPSPLLASDEDGDDSSPIGI